MKLPARVSILFLFGIFAAGSTALGYYYFYFYSPPLRAAEEFMSAMEAGSEDALRQAIIVSVGLDSGELREPSDSELRSLLQERFQRGRIVDQRRREGSTRNFDFLVYREPDGRIFALVATQVGDRYRIVIPARQESLRHRYLWDYTWTN